MAVRLAGALATLLEIAEYHSGPVAPLLSRDRITATLAHLQRQDMTEGARANIRGRLNRLLKAVTCPAGRVQQTPVAAPHPPYSDADMEMLRDAAEHPLAPPRWSAVLALGVGAGVVAPALQSLHGREGVLMTSTGPVTFCGSRSALADTVGLAEVTVADWAAARVFADSQPTLPRLCHRRLRRTWLVGLLTSEASSDAVITRHGLGRRELDSAIGHIEASGAGSDVDLLMGAVAPLGRFTPEGSPDLQEEHMASSRPHRLSAAAARRLRAAALTPTSTPLTARQEAILAGFEPRRLMIRAHWPAVRPVVHQIMRASAITGAASFKDQLSTTAHMAAWVADQGLPVTLPDLMRHDLIERFIAAGGGGVATNSIATRRWRLRTLASTVNPGPHAPPPAPAISRLSVKAPYTPAEVAAIIRIARTQPDARVGRQLQACIGLGLGAGLDACDLTALRRRDITDDAHGLTVSIRGERARTVPIRHDMADLVRAGIDKIRDGELIVGTRTARKKATYTLYGQAVAMGEAPELMQSRMRTTWLAALVISPIPLATVLHAAGLASARTLTEIVKMTDRPCDDELLRDVTR